MKKIETELTNKWKNKWLFFNGDEEGQQIILIKTIYYICYKSKQLLFDGFKITLFNENSVYGGQGIHTEFVEEEAFCDLYYIEYIDKDKYNPKDFNDEEYSSDFSNPTKLDAALSSHPIDTDLNSRTLTFDELKEILTDYLFGEYGCINNLLDEYDE